MSDLPGSPQDHMDALLRVLLPFARQSLGEFGTFFPFGAWMAPDGEVAALVGEGEDEQPTATEVLELLYEALRGHADDGRLLAAAVVTDVTLIEGDWPEGIRLEIEHRDADPLTCLLPYREIEGGYEWGELVGAVGERRTFVSR